MRLRGADFQMKSVFVFGRKICRHSAGAFFLQVPKLCTNLIFLFMSLFRDEEFLSSQAMAQPHNTDCDLEAVDEALVDANTARNEEICRAATFERLALGLAGVASRRTFIRDLLDAARPNTTKRSVPSKFKFLLARLEVIRST